MQQENTSLTTSKKEYTEEYLAHLLENNLICGAKKKDGSVCLSRSINQENGRCKHHGGASLTGASHSRFKTGQYSSYMPERLMEKYYNVIEDEDLISVKSDIAVITARIAELLQESDKTIGKVDFEELLFVYNKWQSLASAGQKEKASVERIRFESLLGNVQKDLSIWTEIQNALELKRRLSDTERRRMTDLSLFIPVDKVMNMFAAVANIVKQRVEEKRGMIMDEESISDVVVKIADDARKIFGR